MHGQKNIRFHNAFVDTVMIWGSEVLRALWIKI